MRGIQRFYDQHVRARPVWWAGMLDVESELEARYRDREEKRTLSRLLRRVSVATAVELGCGAGRWLPFLARHAGFVVGVDISLGILAQARRSFQPGTGRVALVGGDVSCLPLGGSVDLVYLSSVLLYLDDAGIVEVARWCARTLPPGALLASRDSVATGQRFETHGDYSAVYRPLAEYLDLFRGHGFKVRAVAQSYVPLQRPGALASRLPRRATELLVAARALRLVDAAVAMLARLARRPKRAQEGARIAHRFVVYERTS